MNKPRTRKARARAQGAELTLQARRLNTMALRVQAYTLDEIAVMHGVSEQTVRRDLEVATKQLDKIEQHEIDHLRRIEMRRLDAWQKKLNEKTAKGHIGAIECCLKIVKLRAELAGLLSDGAKRAIVQVGSIYVNARGFGVQRKLLDESDAALVAIVQAALQAPGAGGDHARQLAADFPEVIEAQFQELDETPKEGVDTEN